MTQTPGAFNTPGEEEEYQQVYLGPESESAPVTSESPQAGTLKEQGVFDTEEDKKEETPVENKPNPILNKIVGVAGDLIGIANQPLGTAINLANANSQKDVEETLIKDAGTQLAMVDFGMDVVGNIPGLAGIDDKWDEVTRFSTPAARDIRDINSIITPSIALGMASGGATTAIGGRLGLNGLGRGALGVTGRAATDASIAALSDYSERDTGVMNALDGWLDKHGNPLGMNIPDAVKVMDGDDPRARHFKLMTEAAGFSVIGDALGYLLSRGKGIMPWFKPKDEVADTYKGQQARMNPDPDSITTTSVIEKDMEKLEDLLDACKISPKKFKKQYDKLTDQYDRIVNEYVETGASSATRDPMNSYVARAQNTRDAVTDDLASSKIMRAVNAGEEVPKFDKDIHSKTVGEESTFKPAVPNGNVARNMVDVDMIVRGETPKNAPPAPVVTEAMLYKGYALKGKSRDIIQGIAEESRATGNFDAVIDQARSTNKSMRESAWQLEADIVGAESVDQLKKLFADKKDLKTLGSDQIEYLTDEAAVRSARAMTILTDTFLGEDITLASARVLKTTANEVSVLGEAMNKFKGSVDEDKVLQVMQDKMAFLFEEYGINKYIAGWSLQNKKWWQRIFRRELDPEELVSQLSEFQIQNAERARKLVEEYGLLRKNNPEAARALAAAVDASNGDIDTLVKLNKWAAKQMSPTGLLVNPDGDGLNLFTKGLKSTWYNNVLSAASLGKAIAGNGMQLVIQPLDYMVGAGIMDIMSAGKYQMVKQGWFAYQATIETQKKALGDAVRMFKKASKDPDSVNELIRKDYRFDDDAKWEVMDRMYELKVKEGDKAGASWIAWMKLNRNVAKNPIMRSATNGMLGVDAYTATLNATASSRFRAYWDELGSGQKTSYGRLVAGEAKHYSNVFDTNGVIKDSWVKHTTEGMALNADTLIGKAVNGITDTFPVMTPFLAFPNTGANWLRRSFNYQPVLNMIGSDVRKTLLANTSEEVAEALLEHGIDASKEAHPEMLLRNLKAIYMGRVANGVLLVSSLSAYALGGNIRGNYPRDATSKRQWQQAGIKPKTINVGGAWMSFDGILPLDPILTMIGDMAYYANDIGEAPLENWRDKLVWTFVASYANNTPLQGLEPLQEAMGGDDSALTRFLANQARSFVPQSGNLGMLANMVSDSTKDIYNDFNGYLMNKMPGFNTMLVPEIDPYTGKEVNAIHNPILRIINAASPVKVHGAKEEWREWLYKSGYPGIARIRKDSTGSFEYPAEIRNAIYKTMGEGGLWKEIEKISKEPKHNKDLDYIRELRASGKDSSLIKVEEKRLPVFREIDSKIQQAKERAEQILLADPKYAEIRATRLGQALVKKYLSVGNVPKAIRTQQEFVRRVEELRKSANN